MCSRSPVHSVWLRLRTRVVQDQRKILLLPDLPENQSQVPVDPAQVQLLSGHLSIHSEMVATMGRVTWSTEWEAYRPAVGGVLRTLKLEVMKLNTSRMVSLRDVYHAETPVG